jgi:hypothetical protein
MSEVLEGLLQKRSSLFAELRALDAGIAAYRRALVPQSPCSFPRFQAACFIGLGQLPFELTVSCRGTAW